MNNDFNSKTAKEIVLNIAANLGRLTDCVIVGKSEPISRIIEETEGYLRELEVVQRSREFEKTFKLFKFSFEKLKQSKHLDYDWAETALTWSSILTHRAKLA